LGNGFLLFDTILLASNDKTIFKMTPTVLPISWFGHKAINTNNIVRLEADRNYTLIFFADGSKTLMAHTLAFYKTALPPCFVRVHKSHHINTEYVKSFGCRLRSEVELINGKRIPVARRRWSAIKAFTKTI